MVRMLFIAGAALAYVATISPAYSQQSQDILPPSQQGKSRLNPMWQTKARALFKAAVEIPTVAGRGEMPKLAKLIASELRAAGFDHRDIHLLPHEGPPGDQTVTLVVRWRADAPSAKPMLILGHLDVVQARREEWRDDPFEFIERDGYFYGRGTFDNKSGVIASTVALLKLRSDGFRPNRDIILFFTGDEETAQNGAILGTTSWRHHTEAEFALNTDTGNGSYTRDGKPVRFGFQTAEKTYQTYFLTVRNRGGHSSQPRRDNAIYELGRALARLERHRFKPVLNETTRVYFAERAKQEGSSELGRAMRRWLANENDLRAADTIEESEIEVGQTRTTCVATMLEAGHAENALPQTARATVNCRIMPGVDPRTVEAELRSVSGRMVEVTPDPSFIGVPSPASPLRADVLGAYREAVRALHGQSMPVIPLMETGASDGAFFRAAGVPTYGIDGGWRIVPDDERSHGLDERIPVRSFYDNVLHWEMIVRRLASP